MFSTPFIDYITVATLPGQMGTFETDSVHGIKRGRLERKKS